MWLAGVFSVHAVKVSAGGQFDEKIVGSYTEDSA